MSMSTLHYSAALIIVLLVLVIIVMARDKNKGGEALSVAPYWWDSGSAFPHPFSAAGFN